MTSNPQASPLRPDRAAGIVPWVTLRSGEQVDGWTSTARVVEDRYGIRWLDTASTFAGHPIFADLHPVRQRRCMDEQRCQVCGREIGDRAQWIVRRSWLTDAGGAPRPEIVSPHPPTCPRCLDVSLRHCPRLRQGGGWCAVEHGQVRAWGVRGTAVPVAGFPVCGVAVDNAEARRLKLVANQRIVAIGDWKLTRDL